MIQRDGMSAPPSEIHEDEVGSTVVSLAAAVEDAVSQGASELERLSNIVTESESRLHKAWNVVSAGAPEEQRTEHEFFALLDGVVGDLRARLDESRRTASTFNIVFFGRTGAGKSTLLSALGGLSGELVSDGRSDFTTTVQSLDWQGCRLYDTPGINGWGRVGSRPELEKAAQDAVQVADIVLLCFDSQGPQASEFKKVAEWVLAYGKPAIAVFNMRNPLWRHPARVPENDLRKSPTKAVRQHADTISSELEAIGLPDVPVVAINSKRGLFARASIPFEGPAALELEKERSTHGVDYLERWSNLPVLETLISACIREGAGQLRLAGLRDGFTGRLRELATNVDQVAAEQQERGIVVERAVSSWLSILGYPEAPRRNVRLLGKLEAARGEPFTSSTSGRLDGQVRHLLKSYLYPHRTASLRAAEDLILDAFTRQEVVDANEFEQRVFDSASIDSSMKTVMTQASDFLSNNLGFAWEDARIDLDVIDRSAPTIRGNVGRGHRRFATGLRVLGLLSGGASAVLGIIALTNMWNPAGWLAATILVGTGAASATLNYVGRRKKKTAENTRVSARAHAVAAARTAVNSYFDQLESSRRKKVIDESWRNGGPLLDDLLNDALSVRVGCSNLQTESLWLRRQSDSQPKSSSPAEVIRLAARRVLLQDHGWNPPTLEALFLGEDWVLDTAQHQAAEQPSEDELARYSLAAVERKSALASYLEQISGPTGPDPVRKWLAHSSRPSSLNNAERADLDAAIRLLAEAPKVAVLGDYSSGKSSLIKRLLADAGVESPSSLHVAAGRATSTATVYPFGSAALTDVPGLQSGQHEHDAIALDASTDAALVIVVLHVNLLIGDASLLELLLLGDETRTGKWARTVYVIGRIDEIGADPHSGAVDFLNRKKRKVEELLSILSSRNVPATSAQVIPLSADPYGMVGDRAPVDRNDYVSANRVWDGVGELSEPLLAMESDVLLRLSAGAAWDRGRSALLSARQRLLGERSALDQTSRDSDRLAQLLETSLAELRLLLQSIERRISRAVNDHVNEIWAEALGAGTDEVAAMSTQLSSWWSDPRLESSLQSLQGGIDQDLADWWKRHSSQLDRELRRFQFRANDKTPSQAANGAGQAFGVGIGVAVGVAKGAHQLGRALGNRDAVYALGKALSFKFKPWGAVKLGARVGKVSAVLGVVAVAFDLVELTNDQIQQGKREAARKAAAATIRANVDTVISDLLAQEDGPVHYAEQRESEIIELIHNLNEESQTREQTAQAISQGIDEIELMYNAGEELVHEQEESEAR